MHWARRAAAVAFVAACALWYFADQRKNPPAFYLDESSIAYNAWTIAHHGVDEYGVRFPLYFKAFGEYKNPVYIYLLAGVFEITHPTNLAARRFSALLGFAAALALGGLAWSLTRRRFVAIVTFLTALATPNLFEISRLVFEVALFPLALVAMLAAVLAAHRRARWNAWIVAALAGSLALITYTYSTGRLLGLLYAAGLLILYTRQRRSQLIAVYALYAAIALIPIAVYNQRHGGALTIRARQISFIPEWRQHPADVIGTLERNLAANLLPLGQSLRGDPNARHHVQGSGGNVLLMTFALAAIGAVIAIRRRDRFWYFVLFAALVSVIPVSVINENYHALRIVPYPLMLIVLSILALEQAGAGRGWRAAIGVALAAGLIQASWFFYHFYRYGKDRGEWFEAGIRRVVYETAAQPVRPIYVIRVGSYIHVLWYAVQANIPLTEFHILPDDVGAPPQSLVISTGAPCDGCREVSRHGNFSSYYTPGG
jgi:4-amino-4-deoxy-L-arabinose transferase-like glycosyltransferase